MYIRRKLNKSGSTSIYILEKKDGKQVLVKSMGSSKEESKLVRLEELARREIEILSKQKNIAFTYDEDEKHVQFLMDNIENIRVVGTELVLIKLFNEIGFNQIPDKLFQDLVISRIVYPGSKLRTIEYLARHYQEYYSASTVYRYMDKLNNSYKEKVQLISYNHTLELFEGNLSVVFYDVSTLYFEASKEDELRKIGFSKDGKSQHPQIVLGLLVSTGGYPLAFEMFEGNKYEGETLIPVLESFKKIYSLNRLIVIADAGLLSKYNINQLVTHDYDFILGARIKNEKKDLKEKILLEEWEDKIVREFEKDDSTRLIVSHSKKRAEKDNFNRERGIQRLNKRIKSGKLTKESINNRGYNKFLKIQGDASICLDLSKKEIDKKWDGLKGYITNSKLAASKVIDNYNQLWQIEKAFRISKTDLKVRPIYHRKEDRIKSHLIIAFSSYKLLKEFERQLKDKKVSISSEKAIDILKSIYSINTVLPVSKKNKEIIIAKTLEQKYILDAFDIKY